LGQAGGKSRRKAIAKEEALDIMRRNEEDGLVLQPNNYQKIDFVCACCGCCCGILTRHKMMPKPAVNWAHNFYSAVETEKCSGCGTCTDKCQVNAVEIDEQSGCATINPGPLYRCGNCVASCPRRL